jgi:hypothetical protein
MHGEHLWNVPEELTSSGPTRVCTFLAKGAREAEGLVSINRGLQCNGIASKGGTLLHHLKGIGCAQGWDILKGVRMRNEC